MTNSYTTGPNLFRKFLLAGVTLALSVLFSVSSWGQLGANYAFNASAGTYSSISATGTAVGAAILADDGAVNITGLSPAFTVNGVNYTNARMCSNGWLALYATTAPTTSTSYTSLSTAMLNGAVIFCPFNADQSGGGLGFTGSGAGAWRQTIGNEHIFEWQNYNRYGITGEVLNYQIRLNTTNGSISFVYGTMTSGASTTYPQIGFKTTGTAAGNWATDINNLQINVTGSPNTCTWADAVTGNANSSTMYLNNLNPAVKPASGQTFTWTPQASPAPVRTFSAVSGISSSGATIAWTAPTGATSYQLQYRAVGQCAWTTFGGAVSAAGTALTGLTDATSYQVRVRSSNGSVFSIWSHIPTSAAGAGLNGYVATGTFTTLALPPTVTNYTPNQPLCSSGGQTVVITGTSFLAGSVPRFNGVNATSVVVNSTTQITCVTPVGITAGNITVQTTPGTSATGAANAYTLSANPVVSLSPSSAVAPCGSFPTTVTASNTATALATTYAWSNNATLSAATGSTVDVTTTSNQSYVVTATDSRGCTGTATLTATVATPTAVTVTPSIPYFCGTGSAVNISATSANTNYVYTFSVVDFGTISNVAASTCDFTVSQTSALKTRAVDAAGACATDVFTSIGVYPFPSPSMTATPDTICAGSTTNLGSGLSAGNFSVASIPWVANTAPVTASTLMNNGTASVALSGGTLDDGGWAGIPLGFSFNYFGTAFTTVACGTNGLVMFGTVPGYGTTGGQLGQFNFSGTAASCTPAGPATGRFFPNCNNPGNVIALMAADGNAGTSATGNIKYWTSGYAPNRIFNLKYDTYRFFGSTSTYTASLRLYETTGIVEIFIDEKNLSNSAIVGLQDATKLIGAVAPNRPTNPVTNAVANWTVSTGSGEAWRFSPPSNYTTAWTPSGSINGTASGTNLFTRTTNALNTLGTNTFNLVVTDQTTGCSNSASPASVSVQVLAIPSVPASADVTGYGSILGAGSAAQSALTICGPQTVTVNYGGTLNPLEVVRWYNVATGGTPVATGLSYTTPSLTAGDTIYVEITNPRCSSPSRFLFDIDYNVPPAISIASNGPDSDVNCGVGPTYSMGYTVSSSNDPNYAYTWNNDGMADTFSPSGASVTLSSDSTTNTSVTAFDAVTGCSVTAVKAFSIYEFPNIVPTATDSIICVGDSTIVNSGVAQGTFSVSCINDAYRTWPGTAGGGVFLANNGVQSTPHAPYNGLGLNAPLDDAGWSGIPLGFAFDYFGTTFTTCNVGTNGVLNFGNYATFNAGQYSFPSGFPSASSPLNTIAVLATDLYLVTSGQIRYWTEGVAPNRVFVLEYKNCPGWTADGVHSAQLHLFETLGRVEIHVDRATGTGTLAGPKTIGLQNGNGTIGTTAPVCTIAPVGSVRWNARNAAIVGGFSQAWRFSPPVDYTFLWSPAGEISGPTSNADIVAYPTATVPGVQTYSLTVTDNVSGCVGAPVEVEVEIIDVVSDPDVVGWGTASDLDGTNTIAFCGEQDVNLYVAAGAGYDSTYNAVWYSQEVGGTGFAIAYYDTIFYGISGAAGITADDSLWVAIDNGFCEGPRRLVILDYQEADSLIITNSSPINCGPSTSTYTSNLTVSSAGAYTYTWSPSSALDVTTGNAVVATINNTVNVTVSAVDAIGFCRVEATSPVSRFNFPEVIPTALNDSICPGGQTLLNSNTSSAGFTIQSTGYSPTPASNTTTLLLNGVQSQALAVGDLDDGVWTGIPIGFTFSFLGNNYTQLGIGTNGNIQFGPTFSTAFAPAFGTANPNNFIALFWTDLDLNPGEGDNSIRYWTSGIAPNRVFSVAINGCRYASAGNIRLSGQIDLYETTGIVIVHIQEAEDNGFRNTIVGCENLTGTIGSAAPNRDNASWSVTTPEGWRFLPPVDYSFSWLPTSEIDVTSTVGTTTAVATSNSATINLTAANSNVQVGMVVTGGGIPANTTVSSITSATQFVLSRPVSVAASTALTFAWTTSGPIALASPSVNTQYQLIVTDLNTGCENSLNNQSYVTVTIASAAPTASFTADDLTATTGGVLQTVNFNNSTPQLGGETYLWTFNPTTVQYAGGTSANSFEPQVQFLEPGNYTATLNVTSCTGTDDLVRTNYITAIPEYCFPEFGSGSGFDGCDDGDAVGNVVITSPAGVNVMQHLNTGCTIEPGAYIEYAPVAGLTTATLFQGTTYSMQVTSVSTQYTEFFAAFLDVDDDGDFNDPLEFLGGNASAATSATFDIGIPTSNVTYGPHRLRVIAAFGTGPLDANDACIVTAYGEAHDYIVNIQPPVILNDIPAFATSVAYSTNLNYPTCYPISGNTSLASNSPESAGAAGNDIWFRFTAQSTAVSITLTSSAFDDYIGLYSKDVAGNYNLIASENVGTGAGDFERLNAGGLTVGTQYWVAVGSAGAGAGGAFSLCIQNLMRSSCAYTIPAGGFRLCDAFKAIYRGAPSQGVTYNFNFTPVASTPGVATSVTGTNGLMALSNPAAALRYGGVYNADVDVLYTLSNSAGTAEPILVDGNSSSPNCTNIPIIAHPLMEVRSSQRCPSTLLRSNFLVGTSVAGSTSSAVCGAINYTYEFTQVTSCADGTVISAVPATYITAAATPYLGLGVLGNLPNAGAWDVRIRPNFAYGSGTFGPVQRINVNNTSAGSMLNEDAADADAKVDSFIAANLYPNPNNGEMVNLNVSGIESDNVFVRITDAMGRIVYTNRFSVEGSLNTIVTFSEPLASGIYNVEFTVDGQIMTERMIVAKQ